MLDDDGLDGQINCPHVKYYGTVVESELGREQMTGGITVTD